jgi:hypothetical protein
MILDSAEGPGQLRNLVEETKKLLYGLTHIGGSIKISLPLHCHKTIDKSWV